MEKQKEQQNKDAPPVPPPKPRRSLVILKRIAIGFGLLLWLAGVTYGGVLFGHYKLQKPLEFETNEPIQVISDAHLEAIYTNLQSLDAFFKSIDLEYFLVKGTLLGAKRNHPPGLFRWEEKATIGILARDKHKLESALANKTIAGDWEAETVPSGFFLGRGIEQVTTAEALLKGRLAVRVYSEEEESGAVMARQEFVSDGFTSLSDIFPTHDCPFYDLVLKCPNQWQKYIKATFGVDAMTTTYKIRQNADKRIPVELWHHVTTSDLVPMFTRRLLDKLVLAKEKVRPIVTEL